jgi:hypothetical protein
MNIIVHDENVAVEVLQLEQLLRWASVRLQVEDRVPNVRGEAYDLKAWYREWASSKGKEQISEPSHLKVEAADEFQAVIPWSELDQALFMYAQEGKELQKGHPLRLYVPDGSSECLNVKSVVKMWFIHDPGLGDKASYGFKNTISLDELKSKK